MNQPYSGIPGVGYNIDQVSSHMVHVLTVMSAFELAAVLVVQEHTDLEQMYEPALNKLTVESQHN